MLSSSHSARAQGRRVSARSRPPATVQDLHISLRQEWNSIPQSLLDILITSMLNSYPCCTVLAVRRQQTP
ncbi:hypothetical protein TNCV_4141261 [Trichonephila clavipes]|nr:hypothetical protein TNCV_4141261 [Trichonephila clavipes]